MNIGQVVKICRAALVATLLMLAFEILFAIPGVSDTISGWVQQVQDSGNMWALWTVMWLIMYVQVCFIPIPAYIVLNAAINAHILNTDLGIFGMMETADYWIFILVVLSAYMVGAMCAYGMGRKWGKKAVKWCAGTDEEYDKWSKVFNARGKWWYAATVFLPCFPDDMLCLVVGSMKFDFKFFTIVNAIGRFVGTVCSVASLALLNSANDSGIPWTLIGWAVVNIAMIVLERVLTHKMKKKEFQMIEPNSEENKKKGEE